MALQRVSALARKEVRRAFRQPAFLFMVFLFPVIFVLAFGAAFGGGGSGQTVYQLGVVNNDQTSMSHSSEFVAALSKTGILNIQTFADNETAHGALSQGKIQAVMIFGECMV